MSDAVRKILLLDEEPGVQRYCLSHFKDYAVLTAPDAGTAQELLDTHQDIQAFLAEPIVAGPELLARCQASHPHTALIVLARETDAGKLRALLGSLTDFQIVYKPLRELALEQAVHQAAALYALRTQRDALLEAQSVLSQNLEQKVGQETRRLEERAQKLEEMNRLKDELVMIAAHDIRAPLSVILGYSDILLSNEPGISENGQAILERIQASASRLLNMVNNILNLAALEEGKLDLRMEPSALTPLVQEVVDGLAGMFEEREVQCTVDIQGDDRPYQLDRVKVQQVLQNLVSNAVKYNRAGGRVHITVRGTPSLITFEVQDSGRGLSPEQVERAFTKFSRFAGGSSPGSGLGLAIAKGLAQLHGGSIWLETQRNEGSVFRFTIVPGYQRQGAGTVLP
ncbi:MAG TPA: hybrid sensor histidine kinase/response regulator [bacterium]|nr:hybrid sensor histidine kinase/response regulator [bacterium]